MKRDRFLSCVLASALVLSLTMLPAAAAFPDVPAGYWAESYINDMTAKGIFKGYDNGEFRPNTALQASEALALCARISVETQLRTEIGQDRAEQIKAIMGSEQSWFRDEYATCIEADIVSYAELKDLYTSGALGSGRTIAKEDFAYYLVRAMQLGPMAEHLATYSLNFTDRASITPGREPYIYLLTQYGIITGTDKNAFEPRSTVTRAVASTMLSRAMTFMEERGTSVELAEYTDYAWLSGAVVSAVTSDNGATLLSLNSPVSGAHTVALPAGTPIYENSMKVGESLLKTGAYARVCLDAGGVPIAVRLSGSVSTLLGTVVGVSDTALLLSVDGVSRTIEYDRFTEVQAGQQTGDRSIIDTNAGYTTAVCYIDQLDRLVAVQLTGGTRREEAIVSGMETAADGSRTIVVSGFDGKIRRFSLAPGATLTVNGLAAATLDATNVGAYAAMRVSNEDGTVSSVSVDTLSTYIQGTVKGMYNRNGDYVVTISGKNTGKSVEYTFADGASISYEGHAASVRAIQTDWFVTARLTRGEIDLLYGYPSATTAAGTVTNVAFPPNTTKQVITVATGVGEENKFELDLANPPQVYRNNERSTLDKIRSGDQVTITMRYQEVTRIDAIPQSANATGTLSQVTQTTSGVTIDVSLDDGGSGTYTITSGVTVTQNDKTISMYDLKLGQHVAMVTNGSEIISIDVDKNTVAANKLSGTVIHVDGATRLITFRTDSGTGSASVMQVSVPNGITIQDVLGNVLNLLKIQAGDTLEIYGAYNEAGFQANIIVRLSD